MINILLVLARHVANHPLLSEQVKLDPSRFRVVTFCLNTTQGQKARWYNPRLISSVRKIIDDEGIHIVNAHLYKPTLTSVLAARGERRPHRAHRQPAVISTIHGLGSARTWMRRLMNRYFLRRVARVVAVCDAVRQDILSAHPWLEPQKVIAIPNGLVYDRFPANRSKDAARATIPIARKEGFWFGAVTRLQRGKNVHTLLEAFRTVAAAFDDARLVVAGTGPEKDRLDAMAQSAGQGDRVAFVGFRNDIPEVLRAVDCFVHTSLREGLPLALLEAMASGLPIVASDRGGIVEVFGQTAMGSMVDPEDPAAIAAAMTAMIDAGDDDRAAMGERARQRALCDFGADRMVASLEELYEEVYRDIAGP